ncbi:hypothetical protein [Massilia glaciei]|uniref:DUF3108 domain-containing protein n=1 Tax=Massilia glaciei TaxID=1524097 RepID=A0A2U2HG38_9BURK|nr:hypothetical protein [Massilia glaciei]PWF43691.1 hypothetical protein C7C56_020590 [Massilia glaciei]
MKSHLFQKTARLALLLGMCSVPVLGAAAAAPGPSDLTIDVLWLMPPNGSTVLATDPINVTFRYRYSKPAGDVRIWARILDTKFTAGYVGVAEPLEPGTDIITRTAYLTEAGTVKTISLIAKDGNSTEILRKDIPVNYTFVPNKAIDALKGDGVGSKIVSIRIAGGKNAVHRKGVFVPVDVRYAINAKHGLIANVHPDTKCAMTHAGLFAPLFGNGIKQMGFTVGEKCVVTKIKLVLWNTVQQKVYDETVEVNMTYTD